MNINEIQDAIYANKPQLLCGKGLSPLRLINLRRPCDLSKNYHSCNQKPPTHQFLKDRVFLIAWAVWCGHLELLQDLVQSGFDINTRLNKGWTLLMIASYEGNSPMVRFLLQQNADPNLWNKPGDTALMHAAWKGHLDVVKLLLEQGADPNYQSRGKGLYLDLYQGNSALSSAARNGDLKIVQLLVSKGAVLNSIKPLVGAAKNGHQEVLNYLIQMGVEPNSKDSNGNTILMLAACNGCGDFVNRLIEKGAQPNAKNNKGTTALMFAVRRWSFDGVGIPMSRSTARIVKSDDLVVVRILLKKGADPNAKDTDGVTVLMHAAGVEMIQLLLSKGADPTVRDRSGKRAWDYATQFRSSPEVMAILE